MHNAVFIATSLDGYIARSDGSLDWLPSPEQSTDDYGYQAFTETIDTIVLGRATYDTVLSFNHWPYDNKRCVVLTNRPSEAKYNEEFFTGSVERLVQWLQTTNTQRTYIDGGKVIQQFLACKLIHEMTITVIPIILGNGRPLFSPNNTEQGLELVRAKSYASGLVQLHYKTKPAV